MEVSPFLNMSNLIEYAPTTAQRKAESLRRFPAIQFNQLLQSWKQQVSAIWDDENPQGILDELGTDGAALFALSASLAAYLESVKAVCTAETLAKVKAFTVEEDGRIAIIAEE